MTDMPSERDAMLALRIGIARIIDPNCFWDEPPPNSHQQRKCDRALAKADRILTLRADAQSFGVRDGREIHRAAAFLECASSLESSSLSYRGQRCEKAVIDAFHQEATRLRDAAVLIRKKYDEAGALSSDTSRVDRLAP